MDNNQQQIPPQQPVQPVQKNNNSSFLKTLSIGLGVVGIGILIGIGGYFLGAKKSQPPVQKIVVSPTPTPDPTANWNTYADDQENFLFKYPAEAKIVGNGPVSAGKDSVVIGKAISVSGLNLNLDMSVASYTPPQLTSNEHFSTNGVLWNVVFNDPKGNCSGGLGPCVSTLTYQAVVNNKMITFVFRDTDKRIVPEQILSTFKFLQ